jgi:hypothetical protein
MPAGPYPTSSGRSSLFGRSSRLYFLPSPPFLPALTHIHHDVHHTRLHLAGCNRSRFSHLSRHRRRREIHHQTRRTRQLVFRSCRLVRTSSLASLLLHSHPHSHRLTLISTPLLFFPRILSVIFASLLITDAADGEVKNEVIRQLNVLERSMAGFAGFSCLAFAAVLVVQVSFRSLAAVRL